MTYGKYLSLPRVAYRDDDVATREVLQDWLQALDRPSRYILYR